MLLKIVHVALNVHYLLDLINWGTEVAIKADSCQRSKTYLLQEKVCVRALVARVQTQEHGQFIRARDFEQTIIIIATETIGKSVRTQEATEITKKTYPRAHVV